MEKNRELIWDDNVKKFYLKTYDKENDLRTEKGYTKEQLKEIHQSLKNQLEQVKQGIASTKKTMKANEVKMTKEEEKIADIMEKASKLVNYRKQEEQLKNMKNDFELFTKQKAEIEQRIPELKRN